MVIYEGHKETERGLQRNIPPPATPIGNLLFQSGCIWFKDWYFTGGYKEGSVKLQGEKTANKEARRKALVEIHQELSDFLNC
ncbi:hypothetical protein AKJ58_01150 [candidate division MSBL1 archaeon SCGC-AAA385D11]|uniref:Uncharacterized protein n=1 Tax=candidate division MSBL1 archaeon SCGC-AAA385D11 TaxID=1698286 RepID=A0A133VNJ9_9EURY|nr:hypothetical protein AKJ58_01150 [candidate division MSBL1 archaeon SCGC-AAA385D11]